MLLEKIILPIFVRTVYCYGLRRVGHRHQLYKARLYVRKSWPALFQNLRWHLQRLQREKMFRALIAKKRPCLWLVSTRWSVPLVLSKALQFPSKVYTPLITHHFSRLLDNHRDRPFIEQCIHGATNRVPLGYCGLRLSLCTENSATASKHSEVRKNYFFKEISLRHGVGFFVLLS